MIELLAGPWGPLVIFTMRVMDVTLGTLRLVYVTRGARGLAATLGFGEILIWITAAGSTILNFTSPLHVLAYASGFAAGTWVGMWLEERAPVGTSTVQVFCRGRDSGVADALRGMGLGVTEVAGEGLDGPVDIVSTVVKHQLVPRVLETVDAEAPQAFVTVYAAQVRRGWFPGTVRKK